MITEEQVLNALRDVEDPEFPTSIVDLGLVCGVSIDAGMVSVSLTLTSMGCPAVEWIQEDIKTRLMKEPGVSSVETRITWDPVWSKARITAKGRDDMLAVGVVV